MTNIQIKDFILAILKKAYPNNNEENHPNSLRKPKAVTNRRATRMLKELVGISIFEPLNRGHGSSATTLRRRLLTKLVLATAPRTRKQLSGPGVRPVKWDYSDAPDLKLLLLDLHAIISRVSGSLRTKSLDAKELKIETAVRNKAAFLYFLQTAASGKDITSYRALFKEVSWPKPRMSKSSFTTYKNKMVNEVIYEHSTLPLTVAGSITETTAPKGEPLSCIKVQVRK
jgi:hypothetical protein